jgi:hypothetical protein
MCINDSRMPEGWVEGLPRSIEGAPTPDLVPTTTYLNPHPQAHTHSHPHSHLQPHPHPSPQAHPHPQSQVNPHSHPHPHPRTHTAHSAVLTHPHTHTGAHPPSHTSSKQASAPVDNSGIRADFSQPKSVSRNYHVCGPCEHRTPRGPPESGTCRACGQRRPIPRQNGGWRQPGLVGTQVVDSGNYVASMDVDVDSVCSSRFRTALLPKFYFWPGTL